MFFVEGRLPRDRKRAQDRVRLEDPEEPREGQPARGGHEDPPLRARLPRPLRLHALADEHRGSAKDAVLPEVRLAAAHLPEARLPGHSRGPSSGRSPPRADRSRRRSAQASSTIRDDIAALIIEPIQGEGGDNHFRPEFFRRCGSSPTRTMLLLIDEVQTGVGLTGPCGGGSRWASTPDLFAFGKKTQVCGFAANHRVDEEPDNVFKVSSRINSTWGGNLVDMIRCATYPRDHRRGEPRRERARRRRVSCRRGSRELAAEFPGVMSNVRGRGPLHRVRSARQRPATTSSRRGSGSNVMGLASGANAIRLRPHLMLTKDEALLGVQRLRAALAETVG